MTPRGHTNRIPLGNFFFFNLAGNILCRKKYLKFFYFKMDILQYFPVTLYQ